MKRQLSLFQGKNQENWVFRTLHLLFLIVFLKVALILLLQGWLWWVTCRFIPSNTLYVKRVHYLLGLFTARFRCQVLGLVQLLFLESQGDGEYLLCFLKITTHLRLDFLKTVYDKLLQCIAAPRFTKWGEKFRFDIDIEGVVVDGWSFLRCANVILNF